MYCFSCFPIAFCLLMYSTAGQDFKITCPPEGFTAGVNDSITCKVKKSAFASACVGTPTLVKFHFTPLNGVQNEWCTSSYSTCPDTGTPDVLCGNCSCGCENDDGTFLTHRLDFIPTSAHHGGSFTCKVVCLNSGTVPTLTSQNCSGVLVAASTTTTPDTTSASPTSPTSPDQGSDLIWLLLLLPLLILLLILIIIFCCPCGNIACHWCCCTGRCYCRCADKAGAGGCGAAWCKKEDNFISHVCYLCGYKKVKEEKKEFICCSLEKCEMVPTTRSGQRDNKVDADHVATNGARNRERVSTPVQETELTKVRETSSPPSGEEETSPNGAG